MADQKPLKIHPKDARHAALVFAASLVKSFQITSYEGVSLREGCEITGDVWEALNSERNRIVEHLAKKAGVDPGSLYFDEDGS